MQDTTILWLNLCTKKCIHQQVFFIQWFNNTVTTILILKRKATPTWRVAEYILRKFKDKLMSLIYLFSEVPLEIKLFDLFYSIAKALLVSTKIINVFTAKSIWNPRVNSYFSFNWSVLQRMDNHHQTKLNPRISTSQARLFISTVEIQVKSRKFRMLGFQLEFNTV